MPTFITHIFHEAKTKETCLGLPHFCPFLSPPPCKVYTYAYNLNRRMTLLHKGTAQYGTWYK